MANTTITDIPRRGAEEQDKFGLLAYERGLEAFLRGASTPITVALQGEWGSGKTSLMNVLRDDLCGTNDKEGEYYSVWINTWEYSFVLNLGLQCGMMLLRQKWESPELCECKGFPGSGEPVVTSKSIKI